MRRAWHRPLSRRRALQAGAGILGASLYPWGRAAAAAPAGAEIEIDEVRPGNVFAAVHRIAVSTRIHSAAAGTYGVDLLVRGPYGGVAFHRNESWDLAADADLEHPWDIETGEYGRFEATARLSGAAGQIGSAAAALARVPEPYHGTDPASPWGIGGGGAWIGIRFDEAGADLRFRLMHEAGIAYSREELFWNNLEPSAGSWAWNRFDPAMRSAREHGVLMLGLLDYWADWSVPDGYGGKSTGVPWSRAIADYANFCRTVVQRYKPGGEFARQEGWRDGYGIRHWEIWNEPPTFWSGTAAEFGALVKAAVAAIRSADPQAVAVVSTGGAGFDQQVIDVAGIDSYDALAIHLYPGPVGPEAGGFVRQIGGARELLDANGGKDVRIWITEMGWNVNGGVSPADQAAYIARAGIETVAAGVERSLIFTLSYGGEGWGILDDAMQPRASYCGYATVSHQMHGLTPHSTEPMGSAVRACVYGDGRRSVAAVWSTDESGSLTIGNPADIQVVDLMNNPIAGTRPGTLSVPLTGAPHFLQSTKLSADELGARVRSARIGGIAPLGIEIANLPDLPTALPPLSATITNRVNVTQQGTVSISLPDGWAVADADVPYGPLRPGDSVSVQFPLTQVVLNPDNTYPVSVTVTTNAAAEPLTAARTLFVTAIVRGTPVVNGDPAEFRGAAPVHVDQAAQVVGIPDWTPQNCSTTASMMWDQDNFYFAADVTDNVFSQPYTGSQVWNGDSVQLMFDPQNVKHGKPPSAQEYALARTGQGPQIYRFSGPGGAGPVTDATLVCTPGTNGNLSYTVAIPMSTLTIEPVVGNKIGLDFLVNDNDGSGRVGWIYWTPGIGNAWDSAQFSTWTLVDSLAYSAARITANEQRQLPVPTGTGEVTVRVANHGLGSITIDTGTSTHDIAASGTTETTLPCNGPITASGKGTTGSATITVTPVGASR